MRILPIILALLLTACESTKPQNVDLSALYDPAEIVAWNAPGKGTISGQGSFRTRGGRVVTCAGFDVFLAPDIELSRRQFLAWRQRQRASVSEGRLSQLHPYAFRTERCDLKGNFAFKDVANGKWIVAIPLIRTEGGDLHEEMLMGVVEVEGPGEHTALLRERGSGFIVIADPWPKPGLTIPAAVNKHRFIVDDVEDLRADKSRIGEKWTSVYFNGDVSFGQDVGDFTRDIIVNYVKNSGNSIVKTEPATKLNIILNKFWFVQDWTLLYWNIHGEIVITIMLTNGASIGAPRSETFRCSAAKKEYINPNEKRFKTVIDRCVVQLMESVSRSEIWNFPSN